jgi:hypothetical protein
MEISMNRPIIKATPIVSGISALIISFLLVVFNVGNAYAFFWDTTDYSAVEKAFKSNKPIQFFEYKNNKFCETWDGIDVPNPDKYTKKMMSSKRHSAVAYHYFAPTILSSVAAHMEGKSDKEFADWVDFMVTVANKRIMTDNYWTGGNSPAYGQTIMLYNIAVFLNYMDVKGLWKEGQREAVVGWGDELYENSHYDHHSNGRLQSHRWSDTVSRAAASYALWAVATKNLSQFKDSYRDFMSLQKKIKVNGAMNQFFEGHLSGKIRKDSSWDLYLETKMSGDMVVASYMYELVDMPAFAVENKKGGSVKKLVKWVSDAHIGPNHKLAHKGWQDDRHIDNRRADTTTWMTVYRLMDKSDSIPLAKHHLRVSENFGYSQAKTITYSRCLANELN